jgi:Outer membrane protein beta-barrel domain
MRVSVWIGIAAAVWAGAASGQRDPLATRGGWEAGVQASHYHYEEPNFAQWTGDRVGLSGSYTFLGDKRLHSRIEGRFSYGSLDYDGSGTRQNDPDRLYELRALAGRDYAIGRTVWAPYVGLGIRYLYNDSRGVTSTGKFGYRRTSRYFYLPLGVTLRVPLGERWVLAPQLEYDAFANGNQSTKLSDVSPLLPDINNRQSRGHGARAELRLEGPRWSFGLWTHYWSIKDSDIQPLTPTIGLLEPANTTHESGIDARYRF